LSLSTTAASALQPPADTTAVEYWNLPTGSRLAYVRIAARRDVQLPPVVYLHGGPGAYEVASVGHYLPFAAQWAQLGFNVYFYDQVGSGLSSRLADPTNYSVARHVADLEAIRVRLGAARLILIGESWGATLAAHYLARHSARVLGVAFVSPGAIHPGENRPPTPRFDPEMLAWVRSHRPDDLARCTAFETLLAQAPAAAYRRYGDAWPDSLLDAWVSDAVLGRAVHHPALVDSARMHGMGWWAWTFTNWDLRGQPPIHAALRRFNGPVLVLHGRSDYLSAEIADGYARTFPRAHLIHIPDAGHLIWVDQPAAFARAMTRFLESAG
jgi:proline iminopeptidase